MKILSSEVKPSIASYLVALGAEDAGKSPEKLIEAVTGKEYGEVYGRVVRKVDGTANIEVYA